MFGMITGAYSAREANKAKRRGYNKLISEMGGLQDFIRSQSALRERQSAAAYDPFLANFGENAQDYYDALGNMDLSQYDVTTPGAFEFDMDAAIEASMNPEIEAIINRGTGAVESSAASRGALRSGATQKQVARSAADITAQEYDKAADRAQQQYQNKYQAFVDAWNQELQAKQFNRQGYLEEINAKGKLYSAQSDMFGRSRDEITGIQSSADQGILQTKAEIAQAEAGKAGMQSDTAATIGGAGQGFKSDMDTASNFISAFK